MIPKEVLKRKPPNEVILTIKLPENMSDYEQLQKFLWKNFNIDVDTGDDDYGELFYNADLRSFMGFVESLDGNKVTLRIFPEYYVSWKKENGEKFLDPDYCYTDEWLKLVDLSEGN